MQLPIELQVYTKCSGHGTLEGLGCEDRDVAAEKRVNISGVIAGGVTLF